MPYGVMKMSVAELKGIQVIRCYECTFIERCKTCDHPHEIEGVKYDIADYVVTVEEFQACMVDGFCPVCGSYRVEVV